jgi:hypothetical protein
MTEKIHALSCLFWSGFFGKCTGILGRYARASNPMQKWLASADPLFSPPRCAIPTASVSTRSATYKPSYFLFLKYFNNFCSCEAFLWVVANVDFAAILPKKWEKPYRKKCTFYCL